MSSFLTKFASAIALAGLVAACDAQSPDQQVRAYLGSAAAKVRAGELDAAVIELKNALQIAPQNAEARARLGRLYLASGDGPAAAKELGRAREYGDPGPALTADLARALLLAGEHAQVLDLIPAGSTQTAPDAESAALLGLRAQALLGAGRIVEAAATAERAAQATGDPDARLALGRVAAQRGNRAAALARAQEVLELRPGDIQALWLKAVVHLQAGETEAAVAALDQARRQAWRPVGVDLHLIRIALTRRDLDEAGRLLDTLPAGFAGHPQVRLLQAIHAIETADFERARMTAETLLSAYPDLVQAALIAGAAHLELGNLESARKRLQRFVEQHPDHRRARVLLARAWRELGDADAAAALLDAAEPTRRQYASARIPEADAPDFDLADQDLRRQVRERIDAILRHARDGDFETAMREAVALEGDLPGTSVPTQIQAVLLWEQGERVQAMDRLKAVLEQAPDDVGAAVNLARMLRDQGEAAAALNVLRPALEAHPDNVPARLEAARAHSLENDADAVRAQLEAALRVAPDNSAARAYLARLHLQQDRAQQALAVIAAAPEAVARTPGMLELSGMAHQRLGNTEAALAAFRDLAERAPEQVVGHLRVGTMLLAMKQPAAAVAPLSRARAAAPGLKEPAVYLAQALLETGRTDRAARLIADLEQRHPDAGDVAVLRGNHALAAGDPEGAVRAFRRALELEPTEGRAVELAGLLYRQGRLQDAIETLRGWRDAHGGGQPTQSALAEIYMIAGRYADAEPLYRDLVAAHGEDVGLRNNFAWTLHKLGRTDAARIQARAALERAPGDPAVLDTAGVIALAGGDADTAVAHLAKAAGAAPTRADIQLNYAEALLAASDTDAARRVLDRLAGRSVDTRLQDRLEALQARVTGK